MDLFYVLLVLLVVTRAFGELVSGIVLGAVVGQYAGMFPTLSELHGNRVFSAITDLGVFFIMLYAGIEMQPSKIVQHSRASLTAAVGGMILPLVFGLTLGAAFLPASSYRPAQMLLLGTALAITAVPATVKILIDLGKLETRSGQVIVSAAVFDDVLSLLLLAWLTGLITAGATPGALDFAILAGKIVVFFAITAVIGLFLFPWGGRFLKHVKEKELGFSAMLIAAFAVLAEALALHFILGAFVAGVFFGRKTIDDRTYESVESKVSGVTFGFLAPIFFASIGLNLSLSTFSAIPVFLVLLLVAAFVGKFLGAGAGAYIAGLDRTESTAVGVGMSARGAVELVIASIALEVGVFSPPGVVSPILTNLFSAVVIMAIVTTVVTPILLRQIYGR